MKVGFVTNGVITRHATMKRAYAMAPLLAAEGHQVTIVAEEAEDNRSAIADSAAVTLKTYWPHGGALRVRAMKEQLLAETPFDVVHVCGLGWRNSVRRSRFNSKVVIMDHVEIESTLADTSPARRWLQARLEQWSLSHYRAHIGASRYLEAWLRQHCFARKRSRDLLWLPYANDFSEAVVDRAEVEAVRTRHGARKVLLYFGNFYRQYGFWDMLRAVKELAHARQDFVFIFAGKGPEQAVGERFVREEGLDAHVLFPGFLVRNEAAALIAAAHATVVPLADTETDWARCPGKLFICMGSRRPIVTAAIGEAREYFTSPDYFYDGRRPASMSLALARALDTASEWTPNYHERDHTWLVRVAQWSRWTDALLAG